jgi:hypothetical protein
MQGSTSSTESSDGRGVSHNNPLPELHKTSLNIPTSWDSNLSIAIEGRASSLENRLLYFSV